MRQPDYDTIRGLEKKARPVFRTAGIAAIVGLLLMIFGMGYLTLPGIVIFALAAIVAGYEMILMHRLEKAEPVRTIYCPYCASKNEVFISRKEFGCDVCDRKIGMSSNGEPIPVEPISGDDDD